MDAPWPTQLPGRLRVQQADQVITRLRTQKTAARLALTAGRLDQTHPLEVLIARVWLNGGIKVAPQPSRRTSVP